ncbi:MAG: NAD-binding protein [Thiobacillaceae bacterium]|jgi:Trk K+ transport system NAD-binding subunit|nr:NAD-binding protein [Thiobacillaceae bacterium]
MHSVLFMILRRMRAPLIALVLSYAVSILGMTLMPGVDAQGRAAPPMDFFHAFYFVSYTATTIGFGELPGAFSDAQRAWATFSIYLTVVVWLYSIGTILALLQDPAYRRVRRLARLQRKVRRLRQPFYILCGYGETGELLLTALDARGQQAVVLDIEPRRIGELETGHYHLDVPALSADVRLPENLIHAGLHHPHCAGVVALTNDDQANLTVAVTAKLMRPRLPVLCRADTLDVAANMLSFGTDEIVNAFEAFAEHLAMALNAPGHYLLYEWLTDVPGHRLIELRQPPRGKWVVCGYGRFGKAVVRYLRREGIATAVVEADPARTGCADCIRGRGTEAATLMDAGIQDAVGIVAGTDDDINNLSIIMTALELNPGLFTVIRQNRHANAPLFERLDARITMQPSHIVAHEFLSLLTTPLLVRFFSVSRRQDNDWANELISRIAAVVGETVPEVWGVELSREQGIGCWQACASGLRPRVADLLSDPADRSARLAIIPLLLRRGGEDVLLPDEDTPLRQGDGLLFCGAPGIHRRQALTLRNYNVLAYLLTGQEAPGGWLWERINARKSSR